jgi:hypothetical protein
MQWEAATKISDKGAAVSVEGGRSNRNGRRWTVVQPARCWRLASTRERWEKTGVSKDAYVNGPGVGFGAVHAAGACRDRRRTGPARAGPRLGMWGRRADALYECGEMMVRFMGRGTSRKEHVWEDEVRSWTRR